MKTAFKIPPDFALFEELIVVNNLQSYLKFIVILFQFSYLSSTNVELLVTDLLFAINNFAVCCYLVIVVDVSEIDAVLFLGGFHCLNISVKNIVKDGVYFRTCASHHLDYSGAMFP